jgi:ubiquinone/menaquinone biosynthesis C-methylase UbiE
MGWWTDHVVPRMADRLLDTPQIHDLRRRACVGLGGDVVEIGFGSGLNASHYPSDVRTVAAVEPSDVAWRMAQRRVRQAKVTVRRAGLDGQRLDLEPASFDCALSTFTMCTIPDLDAALREIVRVLKPGGSLHFVEHGLSPDPSVAIWQRRLQPLNKRLAGGCHLDRAIRDHVARSGLHLDDLETLYGMGPKPFGYLYLGRAVKRT